MVNCAMMGADWRGLTWWEYTAMLTVWNDRHSGEKGPAPLDPSKIGMMKAAMAMVP